MKIIPITEDFKSGSNEYKYIIGMFFKVKDVEVDVVNRLDLPGDYKLNLIKAKRIFYTDFKNGLIIEFDEDEQVYSLCRDGIFNDSETGYLIVVKSDTAKIVALTNKPEMINDEKSVEMVKELLQSCNYKPEDFDYIISCKGWDYV